VRGITQNQLRGLEKVESIVQHLRGSEELPWAANQRLVPLVGYNKTGSGEENEGRRKTVGEARWKFELIASCCEIPHAISGTIQPAFNFTYVNSFQTLSCSSF